MTLKTLQEKIIKANFRAEEELLIKVLTQYLGREPTEEDAKKCRRVKIAHDISPNYDLYYEDVNLGVVEFTFDGLNFRAYPE